MQTDLFSYRHTENGLYPYVPGHQRTETSHQAAKKIHGTGRSKGLKEKCLEILKLGDFTADEIAEEADEHYGDIRPRCSELSRAGLIIDTGIRRPNERGNSMIVWRVKK